MLGRDLVSVRPYPGPARFTHTLGPRYSVLAMRGGNGVVIILCDRERRVLRGLRPQSIVRPLLPFLLVVALATVSSRSAAIAGEGVRPIAAPQRVRRHCRARRPVMALRTR
jgi:hypothetical protein